MFYQWMFTVTGSYYSSRVFILSTFPQQEEETSSGRSVPHGMIGQLQSILFEFLGLQLCRVFKAGEHACEAPESKLKSDACAFIVSVFLYVSGNVIVTCLPAVETTGMSTADVPSLTERVRKDMVDVYESSTDEVEQYARKIGNTSILDASK